MENKYGGEEQFLRDQAAKQIKNSREDERKREYAFGRERSHARGLLEYTAGLKGMTHFLSYVRSLSFQKQKLLDIGSGQGRALSELIKADDINYNLEISGTALFKDAEYDRFSVNDKIKLMSAETLKGVGNGEVSGIISVHGIGHSKAPELVAKSISRVLAPSGVLKTTYLDFEGGTDEQKEFTEQHARLLDTLRAEGFDVAVFEEPTKTFAGKPAIDKLVTAIKPPVVGITANKLMALDFSDFEEQIKTLLQQGFKPEAESDFNRDDDEEDFETIQSILKHLES